MTGLRWTDKQLADYERRRLSLGRAGRDAVRGDTRLHPAGEGPKSTAGATPQAGRGAEVSPQQSEMHRGPLPATAGDRAMGEATGPDACASRSAPHAERRTQKRTSHAVSAPFQRAAAGHIRSGEREGDGPSAHPVKTRRKRPEEELQKTVAAYLDWALPADHRWLHIPNQRGTRDRWENELLKGLGVKAGAADVLILRPGGRLVWIELKAPDGALSEAQADWRDWLLASGAPWYLCYTLDAVIAACHHAGIPLRVRAA